VSTAAAVAGTVATELSTAAPVDGDGDDEAGEDGAGEDGDGDGDSEDVDAADPEHAAPARPRTVMPPIRRNDRRSVDDEVMATIKHRIDAQHPRTS
jgi:hypothetical protein